LLVNAKFRIASLQMRSALSIFLALVMGIGPLAPIFGASEDPRLPACCRRHGAHRCAMSDATMPGQGATAGRHGFQAPSHCPNYPENAARTTANNHAFAQFNATISILAEEKSSFHLRKFPARSGVVAEHAVRGPPSEIPA